jgi:alanyl-tRNA synthetase
VQAYHQATDYVVSTKMIESERLIADHTRALLFLVADGAPPPGKGGRSGIIKKLIRGILTHQKTLGVTQATFIEDLVDSVLDLYQDQNPGLETGRGCLLEYFEEEADRFEQTLAAGFRRLDRIVRHRENGAISGQQALDLVKRRGIPLPLLEVELDHRGINFNKQEYWAAYARWKQAEAGTR